MSGREQHPLRPSERVQKLLLSTPAHFVGEFDAGGLLITHAHPPMYTGRPRWYGADGDPLRRTAVVLAFLTPPPQAPAPGVVVPNYEPAGEIVASALSVLFGKRFDVHGPFEMSGFYGVPELSGFTTPCDPKLRHNDERLRADRGFPLDLAEARRIAGLFIGESADPRVAAFHAAARFYRKALLAVETDPEGAYLNLITAGEIVSNASELPEDQLLDDAAREVLGRIEAGLPDGADVTRFLRGRLRGIRRRFIAAIVALVDDGFFDRREAQEPWASFTREDFRRRIAAAYDLRSRFVHTGYPFGGWVGRDLSRFEVQVGKPVVEDADMAKVLALAPLFSGLERVIRYALLSFAENLGADVEVGAAPTAR